MPTITDEEKIQLDGDIAEALINAAEYKKGEQRKIVIRRAGKVMFSFRVEGISQDKFAQARRDNTRNRGKRSEELDDARFFAQIIYYATVDEDKSIWKNATVQERLNCATPIDVVNAVITPAEKIKIGEIIEELSGFGDSDLESVVENL